MSLLRAILILLLSFGLNSCLLNKGFKEHLLKTISDSRYYELPTIQIIDSNIYTVLDSAIYSLENCKHFDRRVKYMYAFMLSSKKESTGGLVYSIFGSNSIEFVVGLNFNRSIGIDDTTGGGCFFYKNYLFYVPLDDSKGNAINFPFCKETGCNTIIKTYSLYDEKSYDSHFDFLQENHQYRVVEDHMCGNEILIK